MLKKHLMKNNLENLTKLADFAKNYGADLIIMEKLKDHISVFRTLGRVRGALRQLFLTETSTRFSAGFFLFQKNRVFNFDFAPKL